MRYDGASELESAYTGSGFGHDSAEKAFKDSFLVHFMIDMFWNNITSRWPAKPPHKHSQQLSEHILPLSTPALHSVLNIKILFSIFPFIKDGKVPSTFSFSRWL